MNILITGANRGIGAELFYLARDRGHTAIGTTRAMDDDALLPLDVRDPASFEALAKRLSGMPLDIVVCNAGVYLDKGLPMDSLTDTSLWADTFATNVTGVFLTAMTFLPNLALSDAPKIAIISSQMGSDTRAGGNAFVYRASKAAALNLGRNLALHLEGQNIAIGIYHPGWVQTDMGGNQASIDTEASASGLLNRFDALSMDTTGCFEMWNGEQIPF